MISFRAIVMWFTMWFICRSAEGSVDDFQCACSYNAWEKVHRMQLMLAASDSEMVNYAATYGPLVSRMVFVAHSRQDPTARWLWLLNLFTNTVQQFSKNEQRTTSGPILSRTNTTKMIADALDHIGSDLNEYLRICQKRWYVIDARKSQTEFEKYVLETMTAIVQKSNYNENGREENFKPRCFYLNDVAANGTDRLSQLLTQDAGIDWNTTAAQLSCIYNLSKKNWLLGTKELVLYQRKFMSTVVASMMGYVLVHVTYCQQHWLANFKGANVSGNGMVGEYERMWMSITSILEKFKSYLALSHEAYLKTLTDIVANPIWDDDKFQMVKHVIKTNINDLGEGMFSLDTITVNTIGDSEKFSEKSIIELIALVDNNISAAEKYLKCLQESLLDVDFKIIRDFMRSTYFWLT